jgi:hypothetical protein
VWLRISGRIAFVLQSVNLVSEGLRCNEQFSYKDRWFSISRYVPVLLSLFYTRYMCQTASVRQRPQSKEIYDGRVFLRQREDVFYAIHAEML